MKKRNTVTVIDIGNTKVCCCIASIYSDSSFDIAGVGYCACIGMRFGTITDMDSVEKSIAIAVEQAEKMAGIRVKSAYISISGKHLKSHIINLSLKIDGRIIRENDILHFFKQLDDSDDSVVIIHSIPIWYEIDSMNGVKDPVGMFANHLSVSMNVVTVPKTQLQNMLLCLAKTHLELDGVIATGYAAGVGIMGPEDMFANQTVIDFGGELTTVSFFFNGIFCGSEVIPLGARHITKDIVYGLNISEINAERMKTLHGSAIPSFSDDRDMIYAPVIEESEFINLQQIPKSLLNQFVQARVEEILKITKSKIDGSRFKSDFSRNVIITGGGSLLTGIREAASDILKRPVVLKKIKTILPGTDIQINHNFTVALGMIKLVQNIDNFSKSKNTPKKSKGFLKKTLSWIKNNL